METLEQVTAQRDLLERQLRRVKDALILKIQQNQELGRLIEGSGNGGGQNNLLEIQQLNMQINRLRQALAVALSHNNNQGGAASRIFVNNNQGDDRALREANQ